MKIKILLMIIILLLLSVSCDKGDNGDYLPIESDILFTFRPDNTDGNSLTDNIVLYLKTDEFYSCCNYEIVWNDEIISGVFNVNLRSIYVPEICLTALGPATTEIPWDFSTGEFNLSFTHVSAIDSYHVVISDSSIVVTPINTSFTRYYEISEE